MSILSSLLGLDASSNASKQQNLANQNSSLAGGLYGNLAQTGSQNETAYNQVPGAVNTFQQGLQNNPLLTLFNQGYSNSPLVQSYGQAYGLNVPGQNIQATQGNRTAGVGGGVGTPGQTGGQGQSLLPQDAYGLTQGQQIELNTQLNTLDQAKQNAVAQYQSSFAQRGVDPSQMAAGIAAINEQFSALSEQTKGSFAQNALTQRQQGLTTLLSGGETASQQQNAGNLSVADLLLQQGQQGAGQVGQAASGYGSLAGAAQNQANVNQQQSNSDMSGILNLIGLGATGGLSGLFGGGGGVAQGAFPSMGGGSATGV